MHFHWLVDGSIVGLYILGTMIAGLMVRKYVSGVDDYLVAGREMNLHLGIASLAATEFGIVTCMYTAQSGFDHGFAGATPGILMAIAMFVVGASGFCIEPMRAARVLTIPEFFEQRFGSRIRWASGVVIVLGGLLNMGVFLRVGGEFLVITAGINAEHLEVAMTCLLIAVAVYTVLGGMLSVLVTDYLQFIVMSAGLLVVTALVLYDPGWSAMVSMVERRYGEGGFNPFVNDQLGTTFVIFQSLISVAVVLTWQTTIQRVLAARDSGTGRKIYTHTSFFFVCRFVIPGLWGIAALTALGADAADQNSLHAMPHFLRSVVPIGITGLVVAAMLAADMSTDSAYMLSWGSVIYNDILAPLRRRQHWSERVKLLVNRSVVAGIGVFLLFYGLWYPLKGSLWNYLTITGTIYLSSMSVLLIACCYWKRANNWGAAAAITVGAVVPITYLIAEQVPATSELAQSIGSQVCGIATFGLTAAAMIGGSLLKSTITTLTGDVT